jgi:superfamily II DNA or RNA helicase
MLETSLSNRGYSVSKEHPDTTKIRDLLYVKPHNIMATPNNEPSGFKVYLESSKKMYIPKHYGLTHYGIPTINTIVEGIDMQDTLQFHGSLRDNQLEPVQKFLERARDPQHMGGILQLPPGWGKTVMALYISHVLHKKTLVVVHKDFLLKQWKERIEQYLPNARIGLIKQTIFNTENCDIVLGSLQTICLRDLKDCGFGLLIVDECHHMGAQVFSQAFHKMNFQYSLGLSATVNRQDGLTKVFKWFLGDIVFKAKQVKESGLIVELLEYTDTSPMYCREHLMYNGKPNISKMINTICDYLPRTRFIVNELKRVLKEEPERNVIILSDRRKHLEDIFEIMIENGFTEDMMGYYVGGMKNEALSLSETKQILLGTYNMVSEGFDLPKLDTLVMASPKSNVEQSIGRVQRQLISERKHIPMVLDIIDSFSVFKNQSMKRSTFYKKNGYTIIGEPVCKKDTFVLKGVPFFQSEN